MTEHSDFLEEIVADDPTNRLLAAGLGAWRDTNSPGPVAADERLEALFAAEPAIRQPRQWRVWMQRPAFAFAASFAAVLILGIGAFALVARDSTADTVAASTSTPPALAAVGETTGEITLPSDLSEQSDYAACVLNEVTAWFTSGFAAEDAPDVTGTCGALPIPDLGPEAEAYRQDLQAFANCLTGELDSLLPELPTLMTEGHEGLDDLENKCGEPPDPRDYGLKLPFADLDLENLDLSQFNFGDFDLGNFNLEDLDLEQLLQNLPEGALPEDFDVDEFLAEFENFNFEDFKFDFESCEHGDLEDLENLDSDTFFSEFADGHMCGFSFFGFDGFDFGELEGLDLESLNIEDLLADLETQFGDLDLEGLDLEGFNLEGLDLEGFNLEGLDLEGLDLEGIDLQELFNSLLQNGEFDFDTFFGDEELSSFFESFTSGANT